MLFVGWTFSGSGVTLFFEIVPLSFESLFTLVFVCSDSFWPSFMINPLYTGNRKNKPDIRIDIFVGGIYLKSIPMEAKYRKLKNITDANQGALKQLLAYRDSPKSLLHLAGAKNIRKNNHTVITKVIILYPKDTNSNSRTDILSIEHGLLFYEFGPNYIDSSLKTTLIDEINEAFEIYNDIYKN